MHTTRRNFIKAAGIVATGAGFFPLLPGSAGFRQSLPRRSPESQGVESAGIRAFLRAIKDSGLEWHSFMLLRHGAVVGEGWWSPFESGFKHTLYSLSKSFTSSAIGFLVAEGKVQVTDPVLGFFPEEAPAAPNARLKAMTIRHLLTMNTGHDSDTLPVMRNNQQQSWVKSFLEHPVVHEPGSHFLYNTGATYMLGAIVHRVTGLLLEDYLAPRLFRPLGISGYDWEKSPQGLNTAGYGLRIRTEDIARFGQLYLQKGKWEGQQLLPAAWIQEATSKQTGSNPGNGDWSQGYGYQFWRCKPGFYRGDGAFGQFCIVMPEQDAVLAMTCESWDLQKSMTVAWDTLLPAMKNAALPENPAEQAALKQELGGLFLPAPKGKPASPLAARYSDKRFTLDANPFGIRQISLGLFDDAGVLRVSEGSGFRKIPFGWEKWKLTPKAAANPFPVATRTHMPSRIAASGAWLDDHTLQISLKFVEAIHGDKWTFRFDDKQLAVSFLNSISENTKNSLETREALKGVMV